MRFSLSVVYQWLEIALVVKPNRVSRLSRYPELFWTPRSRASIRYSPGSEDRTKARVVKVWGSNYQPLRDSKQLVPLLCSPIAYETPLTVAWFTYLFAHVFNYYSIYNIPWYSQRLNTFDMYSKLWLGDGHLNSFINYKRDVVVMSLHMSVDILILRGQ